MNVSRGVLFASITTLLCGGCAPKPAAQASVQTDNSDGKRLMTPAELVGKWRLELKEGDASRTFDYNFLEDGRVEVDIDTNSPKFKKRVLAKKTITEIDGDKITMVTISLLGDDGVEDVLPQTGRQSETVRLRVKDDELSWERVDAKKASKPSVLKRIKE